MYANDTAINNNATTADVAVPIASDAREPPAVEADRPARAEKRNSANAMQLQLSLTLDDFDGSTDMTGPHAFHRRCSDVSEQALLSPCGLPAVKHVWAPQQRQFASGSASSTVTPLAQPRGTLRLVIDCRDVNDTSEANNSDEHRNQDRVDASP